MINLSEAFEKLNTLNETNSPRKLNEGVADDDPGLEEGIGLWLKNPEATNLIVSIGLKGYEKPIVINKLAFGDNDFRRIIKEICDLFPENYPKRVLIDISALHSLDDLEYFIKNFFPQYKDLYAKVMEEKRKKER